MPHPSAITQVVPGASGLGWGAQAFGSTGWGGASGTAGFVAGGQVVRRRIGWARGEKLIVTSAGPRVVKL